MTTHRCSYKLDDTFKMDPTYYASIGEAMHLLGFDVIA